MTSLRGQHRGFSGLSFAEVLCKSQEISSINKMIFPLILQSSYGSHASHPSNTCQNCEIKEREHAPTPGIHLLVIWWESSCASGVVYVFSCERDGWRWSITYGLDHGLDLRWPPLWKKRRQLHWNCFCGMWQLITLFSVGIIDGTVV